MRKGRMKCVPGLLALCGLWGIGLLAAGCGRPESASSPRGAPEQPNLVKNGDFAQLDVVDRELPVEWLRSQSTPATVAVVEGDDGNMLRIAAHPEGALWQSLVQTLPPLGAGKEYRVGFEGRASAKEGGRVMLVGWTDEKTRSTLAAYRFANQEWQEHVFSFVMPQESMSRVDIVLGQGNYRNRDLVVEYKNVVVNALD